MQPFDLGSNVTGNGSSGSDLWGLTPEQVANPPEVVVAAEGYLDGLRSRLLKAGGAWVLVYLLLRVLGMPAPGVALLLPLAGIAAWYWFPLTRTGRRAWAILRRWDQASIEGALDEAGGPTDPRMQVAEAMATRVREAELGELDLDAVVEGILVGLRTTVHDLRVSQFARTVAGIGSLGEGSSKAEAELEGRIDGLLGSLTAMHEAVVTRDVVALGRMADEAENVLANLKAARDVELLLQSTRKSGYDSARDG